MTLKQEIQRLISREIAVIKHLYTKIPTNSMEYRPNEQMRSAAELLIYLSHCGVDMIAYYNLGNEEGANGREIMQAYRIKAEEFTNEQFPQAMDAQEQHINEMLSNLSNEDLQEKTVEVFWGETLSFGELILQTTVKYLTAYRMQLFLYAKMAGNLEINTYNCWLGKDAPKAS